jgi:hypothetical protein
MLKTTACAVLATATILSCSLAIAQDTSSCTNGSVFTMVNPTPKGPPFTAVVKATFDQKLGDGNSIHGNYSYRVARSSTGKTLFEVPSSCYFGDDGLRHQAYQVTVTDPAAKTTTHWQRGTTALKMAFISHFPEPIRPPESELPANPEKIQRAVQASQAQIHTERLGSRTFQGVSAEGTRTIRTIPVGEEGNALVLEISNENWRSRELGLMMMSINDDPRRGRTTTEVDELHQGEPDPAIFAPPDGYTVREQKALEVVQPGTK